MGADIITEIFSVVSSVTTGLGSTLTAVFGLLYNSTTPALTSLGQIVVIVIAAPISFSVLAWVVGQFKKIRVFKGGRG